MKKGKRRFKILLLVACSLLLSLPTPYSSLLHATSPQKKLSAIQEQIKEKKQKIRAAVKKEKSILSKIEKINKSIQKKRRELKSYDKRISKTQLNISRLSKELGSLIRKSDKRRKYLDKRLRALYKHQYGGNTLILVKAKDYHDLIRKSRYIGLIAYLDSNLITIYKKEIKEINLKKRNLEILRSKLERSKDISRKKKQELEEGLIKKDRLLATIRSKRSNYERTVKELEESSKKLRELIKRFERKKVPKSVIGRGFRTLKGRLPWPINGKLLIPYGRYKDPKFDIIVFKNGVELKAEDGSRPRAIAGGRVVYSDWFKGYGMLLIINHGNGYHSLYGNLSEIYYERGDLINAGTALGKTGTSTLLNVPTLYFEIRHKGKPVDPMKWLRKKRRLRKT